MLRYPYGADLANKTQPGAFAGSLRTRAPSFKSSPSAQLSAEDTARQDMLGDRQTDRQLPWQPGRARTYRRVRLEFDGSPRRFDSRAWKRRNLGASARSRFRLVTRPISCLGCRTAELPSIFAGARWHDADPDGRRLSGACRRTASSGMDDPLPSPGARARTMRRSGARACGPQKQLKLEQRAQTPGPDIGKAMWQERPGSRIRRRSIQTGRLVPVASDRQMDAGRMVAIGAR